MTKTRLKTIFLHLTKYLAVLAAAAFASFRIDARQIVVDGDTLIIGRERIRFDKIDAFETGQTCVCKGEEIKCGLRSKEALLGFIGSNTVSCEPSGRDIYGRLIAECFIPVDGKKTSLNMLMARAGMAIVISKKDEALLSEEAKAIREKKGVWGCEKFDLPADFRKNSLAKHHQARNSAKAPVSGRRSGTDG